MALALLRLMCIDAHRGVYSRFDSSLVPAEDCAGCIGAVADSPLQRRTIQAERVRPSCRAALSHASRSAAVARRPIVAALLVLVIMAAFPSDRGCIRPAQPAMAWLVSLFNVKQFTT